jgi:Thioesterase superfamily
MRSKYLSPEYTTVGTVVNVKHLNPAPTSGIVIVESKLIAREGRRLLFEVRAYYKDKLIGEGLHERFIVDREKFIEKLRKLY